MNTITVSAPGKIHLLGEHSVVYGKPALLASIDKRVHITLTPNESQTISISYENTTKEYSLPDILDKTTSSQEAWKQFNTDSNPNHLKNAVHDIFDYIAICIGESYLLFKEKKSGYSLSITSHIPLGSGLGSSAALAVSISATLTQFFGLPINFETIQHVAYISEQRVHGNPSGADVAISLYGGIIFFQNLSPQDKIVKQLPFPFPPEFSDHLYILNTGKPSETTGEMVAYVSQQYTQNKSLIEHFLSEQEVLTLQMIQSIEKKDEKEFKESIQKGELNLEKIGVVSSTVQTIIREIEKSGGVAKICGGGGRTSGTGMLLVYHAQHDTLQKLAATHSLVLEKLIIGVKGVRYE